uniref:INT2 n=1 Tax=Arundo donax TaxID=35708 RepID=A0A0A9FM02_ARUDO
MLERRELRLRFWAPRAADRPDVDGKESGKSDGV